MKCLFVDLGTGTMLGKVREFVRDLLGIAYPDICVSCSCETDSGRFCKDCFDLVRFITDDRCLQCGAELGAYSGVRQGCPECKGNTFSFKRVYAASRYKPPVRDLIHALKYGRDFSVLPAIGNIIRYSLGLNGFQNSPARLIPVPLFSRDWLGRGFNQAEELARLTGEITCIPVTPILRKIRRTPKQVHLHKSERKLNLDGVFTCEQSICKGENVVLVDDVFTTGSTLSECAQVLKKEGGARRVDAFVLAR